VTGSVSPLGRYSDAVAAVTAVMLVLAALIAHLGFLPASDTSWLDASAGVAVGVVLGQRQTTNGAGKIAAAAHLRLDKIAAPAADDGQA
jgi:hypothetical protein